MTTHVPNAGTTGVFSIREVAWLLGVSEDDVCRLIRTGELSTVQRRSRLVVPAHALARLLPLPGEEVLR